MPQNHLKYKYYLVLFAGISQKSGVGTKITKVTRHQKLTKLVKRSGLLGIIKLHLKNALKLGILGP